MTIKLIIFDLDGCLVDSRDMHYKALNRDLLSIDEKYVIVYRLIYRSIFSLIVNIHFI